MTEADIVQKQQRFSSIWIVPIIAILAGAWITVQH
jgi:paraquat-inducible protein B